MKMMVKYFLIIYFFICMVLNAESQVLDTIKIFPTKDGWSAKKYHKILSEGKKSFKKSQMDSISKEVFLRNKPCYVMLFNEESKLKLEGEYAPFEMLVGHIRLYHSNGKLKEEYFISSGGGYCDLEYRATKKRVYFSETPEHCEYWKHYNDDGEIFKEIIYSCEVDMANKKILKIEKETIYEQGEKNKVSISKKVVLKDVNWDSL